MYPMQGEQMQCTAHTWLSPRHVLVAADKGKVIHDVEDVNDNGKDDDDFTANQLPWWLQRRNVKKEGDDNFEA